MAIDEHSGRDLIAPGVESTFYETSTVLLLNTDFETPSLRGGTAGGWIRRGNISRVIIAGRADKASDALGVVVEESFDGSEASGAAVPVTHYLRDQDGNTTVGVNKVVREQVDLTLPFWRFRWQNAGTTQTAFNLRVTGVTGRAADDRDGHQYAPVSSAVTKAVVKAAPGRVLHFYATNENASARWFQLHDKATDPAGTEVPIVSKKIPAGTAAVPGYLEFRYVVPRRFSAGVAWAVSTTQATFTDAATASEHTVDIEFD